DPVMLERFLVIGERIMHRDAMPQTLEPGDDVDDLRIAEIRHVLLEGQAQHEDLGFPIEPRIDALRDIGAHPVIDPAAGEDDLRLVADFDRAMREIEGIDADAVAADQSRRKAQEIPFGAGGVEHVMRLEAELLKDHRHFVDEGDVDVALRILDDFRRFRRLDVLGDEEIAVIDDPVDGAQALDHLGRLSGDHLGNPLDRVLAVTGIDAFGRISEKKILAAAQPRNLFDRRAADILGDAGIDRALEDHDGAALDALAHRAAGGEHRAQIRLIITVDRCRYRDNEHIAVGDIGIVVAHAHGARPQHLAWYFAGAIDAVAKLPDTPLADVEAGDREMPGDGDGKGKTDIA